MQILIINNRNFEKSSKIPSKRTKVNIKKIISDTSQPKTGSAYAQSQQKIRAKIKGKKNQNFFEIDQGHIRF
jgi:hypothetical protein